MLSDGDYAELLQRFPPIEFGFAYGSGVIEQGGYNYQGSHELPMLDLVFAVDDPVQWHRDNMQKNSSDYTPLMPFSPFLVAFIQDRFGAGLWYNALVSLDVTAFPHRKMKYGVISKRRLLQDLTTWETLYTAGRLHKPVRVIHHNKEVEAAMTLNREHAIKASLLVLPPKFSEMELFLAIASLSYAGDPRMVFGENPQKVINLVTPIVPIYRELYRTSLDRIFKEMNVVRISEQAKVFVQDTSPATRWKMCVGLPLTMRRLLMIQGRARYWREKPPKATAIRAALASVVARAATSQTMKGLLTVGVVKSSTYLAEKLSKSLFSAKVKVAAARSATGAAVKAGLLGGAILASMFIKKLH